MSKAAHRRKSKSSPKGRPDEDASVPEQVSPAGLDATPIVAIDGLEVNLDDEKLPEAIDKAALTSGGFPYDKKLADEPYQQSLRLLQIELLKLQSWAQEAGERVVVLFEGRDSAGKGGVIQRVTEHLSPRSVHVIALAKPTPVESGQWYFQRYLKHLPTAGDVALFDRSWYNRGAVEPVMGFCTAEQTARFLHEAPQVERLLVEDGIRLFKFWLTIGRETQIKRLHARRHDPLKRWKLSPIDYAGLNLWDSYSHAIERMLHATHTKDTPWTVVHANDKRRLRLAVIRHLLLNIPYRGRDLKAIGGADERILMDADRFLHNGGES